MVTVFNTGNVDTVTTKSLVILENDGAKGHNICPMSLWELIN